MCALMLTPPRRLPVEHLSASAISMYLKSPIRWRKRYIEALIEPISASAVVGRAFGAAVRDSYSQHVETGRFLSTADTLDAFSMAWDHALATEGDLIIWDGEKPGRVKDSGYRVLPVYHQLVVPTITPIGVERGFSIVLPDVEWTVDGYFDVEEALAIDDVKLRGRSKGHVTQAEADCDLQAGIYLLAKRAEGVPATNGFRFHSVVRAGRGIDVKPGDVAVTTTQRTDAELDQLVALIYGVAAEIDWRLEYDVWTPPPPGSWWCSSGWCGFWATCEYGGLHRSTVELPGPRPPRQRLSDSLLMDAVRATLRRDGTTTAGRVGQHLGLSARQASARLAKMPGVTSTRPTKASGRGKDRVVREVRGPRVYRIHDEQEGVSVT